MARNYYSGFTYAAFTVGQVVKIHKSVLSAAAGKPGRVTSIDKDENEIHVIVDGKGYTFWAGWLTPLSTPKFESHEYGRWVTLVGQDGTSRPVTFIGYNHGEALYIEGHVDIRSTLADNIAITN